MSKTFTILTIFISSLFYSQEYWSINGNENIDPDKHYLGTKKDVNLVFKTAEKERMVVDHHGNVGIGTKEPNGKLDVTFEGEPKSIKFIGLDNTVSTMNSMMRFTWYDNTADFGMIRSGSYPIEALAIRFNEQEKVRFTPNGNAAFQGKVEAKEVKVTTTPTADFVFEENYSLPSLEFVEKHIKEKKHLPEIASAKQMEKEGVNIGEFQIQLLQKIEELTLYSIEQNKKIKQLQEENKALKVQSEQIGELKKQVHQILSKK